MKKLIIIFLTASLAAVAQLPAFSFLTDPDFTAEPSLTSGTALTGGAEYDYGIVGTIDVNGTERAVTATLNIVSTTFTNIDAINGPDNTNAEANTVGTVGFQFDNNGGNPADLNPFLVATLSFTFSDGPDAGSAATISNLFATGFDIDSSRSDTNYSDLVGVSSDAIVGSPLLTPTTVLDIETRDVQGPGNTTTEFTTAQLINPLEEGNSRPLSVPGAPNNDPGRDASSAFVNDYAATFALGDASSFTLLYGITGAQSNERTNRNINFTFTTSAIVPEPSSLAFFGLTSVALLLRRKR